MPKKQQKVEVNNFIRGLITEASPLNFPDSASLDEENFELNRDGTRDRRLGMDFEGGYTLRAAPSPFSSVDPSNSVVYKWIAVNGNADLNLLVVQSNRSLDFYDLGFTNISTSGYKGRVTIPTFPENKQFSFTSAEGRLVVAAGAPSIAIVEYDGTTFTITYTEILVRDVWGVEETSLALYETDPTYRSAVNPPSHVYNLQNQSWGIPRKNAAGTLADPTSVYLTDLGVYPSNSETVWPGLQFQPVSGGTTPYERIFPNLYTEVLGAGERAAKGYYTINLLTRGASRAAAFVANKAKYPQLVAASVAIPTDSTSGGASLVTEFAGRVWYAGFEGAVSGGDKRSPNLGNFITFSQLVRSRQDFGKCYQDGDPTSREGNVLVDTDGGFIRITGANRIMGMATIGTSLIVLADNGVFAVTGGSDYGFTATNYKVDRLSAVGCISGLSIVTEGARVFFWSEDGIYGIAGEKLGGLAVTSLTERTIQTMYDAIPNEVKAKTSGIYDAVAKKVRWLYKQDVLFSASSVTKELIFDVGINAFYINRISRSLTNQVEIVGLFAAEALQRGSVQTDVTVLNDPVVVVGDPVYVRDTVRQSGIQAARYLVAVTVGGNSFFTIASYLNTKFKDWEAIDGVGVDAKAYVLTGVSTAGDSGIAKQIPYLMMHFHRTEKGVAADFTPANPSGCLVRSQWDWSTSPISNKWSPLFQAYRQERALFIEDLGDDFDNGFSVVTTKNKIRGRGKAFSLYMESEPLKDCRILGWRLSLNGNQFE
jgi:hypothetical protein